MTGVIAGTIGSVNKPPSVTIGSTTGITESRAVFNATVSANYATTIVKFQYNTTNDFASYTEVTATQSPVTAQSAAVSYTVTGLTKATVVDQAATTYYVRVVATNSGGTTTSSATSLSTWTLRQKESFSTSSPFTVPTVAGVNPAALPVVVLIGGGGGGAGAGGGGGAGGLVSRNNYAFTGSSGYLEWTVGGGGAAGSTYGNGVDGTSSTLSGTNLTSISAGGGEKGYFEGRGGNLGSGDGTAYTGGSANQYVDKVTVTHSGGGAGNDGNGGNATTTASGAGGAGNGFWGNSGGGGGGNYMPVSEMGAHGTPNNVGAGGDGGTNDASTENGNRVASAGSAGRVVFQYYGP